MTRSTTLVLVVTTLLLMVRAEHSTTSSAVADTQAASEQQQANFAEDKYQDLRDPLAYLNNAASNRRLLLSDDELSKRASMHGFQGMRGKKSDLYYGEPAYYYDYYVDEKRAPAMGFQGMRGKKSDGYYGLEDGDDAMDKRVPSTGFHGMRGKKNLEEVLDELGEKRMMLGFQGMRGKKSEEYEDEPQYLVDQYGNQWPKRAPAMGFQGMRGKKSNDFLDQLDELEKRTMLGFHGTRGKKDMYDQEDAPVSVDGYLVKRPTTMGFHGMRGKRSADYYGGRFEKRSPYRFYGMRGKKNPRWELRGKFVGVRGKKWTSSPRFRTDSLPLSEALEELSLAERYDPIRH